MLGNYVTSDSEEPEDIKPKKDEDAPSAGNKQEAAAQEEEEDDEEITLKQAQTDAVAWNLRKMFNNREVLEFLRREQRAEMDKWGIVPCPEADEIAERNWRAIKRFEEGLDVWLSGAHRDKLIKAKRAELLGKTKPLFEAIEKRHACKLLHVNAVLHKVPVDNWTVLEKTPAPILLLNLDRPKEAVHPRMHG